MSVLEEVCKKQGFLPVDDYELKHGRTTIDPTLSFRFANLSNNAKLELVRAAETRAAQNVTIALQLEDGERLVDDFKPETTLHQVLMRWDEAEGGAKRSALARVKGDLHPVCIYMTEEFPGIECLQSTTLRQLGLTKGRAIIRLVHRTVDASTLDELNRKLSDARRKREKLDLKAAIHLSETDFNTARGSGSEGRTAWPQASARSLDESNEAVYNPMISSSRCGRFDQIEIQPPDLEPGRLQPEQQMIVQEISAAVIPQLRARQELINYQLPPAAPFKFPESTRGKQLYKNEFQDCDSADYLACDREAIVYSLDERQEEDMEVSDVPEDFFEVTQADLQSLMKSMKEKVKAVEEQPLMTSSMRQALQEERMSKYDHVVLRVQFPDRLVLQGIFKPRETVHSLEKFVKEHLESKSDKFYLYTTPPKTVLKDKTQTLIVANLAPAAVIHFGTEDKKDGPHLASALLREISTRQQADAVVSSRVIPKSTSLTSMDSHMTSLPSPSTNPKRPTSHVDGQGQGQSGSNEDGKKLPKWFTAGKKK